MNKNIFQGKWEEIKGNMKKTWGKLTDDDLTEIKGSQQEIYGKLQKHYGHSKEQVETAIKEFNEKGF